MNANMVGRVRKLLESIDVSQGGDDEQVTLSQQREILVAPASTLMAETVRAGRAFYTGNVTAVGAVVAIPTTACALALYNNDVDGGRSLVIDWVSAQNVVTTASTAAQAQMIALVGQLREVAPTDAALTIKKCNGMGSGTNDSKARTIVSATLLPATTGLAANWFALGQNGAKFNTTTATAAAVGYGTYCDVNGRFIVPPGRYFALHVLANLVGETFVCFVGWHEKQITLA